MTTPTLHILTNPSAITHTRYRMDPFNVAALKFMNNMGSRGWNMIHYGHESAEVPCEHETCITNQEFAPPENGDLFLHKPELMARYNETSIELVGKRKKPGDMVLCFYGLANKAAADVHSDLKIVEPSIGYSPDTVFAPYRAFVSYSQMHYYYGIHGRILSPSWFDEVIPNAFTPSEFKFSAEKDDYFVYLGRVNYDKGIDLCIQVTRELGKKLIIAGPSRTLAHMNYTEIPDHVEMVGYVGPEQRAELLSRAQCLMAPTHYLEPFGNIVAEAQFCGTPVLTTDWGGFVDSVVPGVTGYRCKDFRSFVEAAKVITDLNPHDCRQWVEQNFSDDVVHDKFDKWLKKIYINDFYA